MIDIKFSGNFDQELDNLFQNMDGEKDARKISQNIISPYCYDIKSIASNNESQMIPPNPPILSEKQSSPLSNRSQKIRKSSISYEKWHPWLFEEYYTLNASKNDIQNDNLQESRSEAVPFSPSKNKLNLNFTFTNEKTRKLREEEFYDELQKKLEENTDDIKRIKENMDNHPGFSTEKKKEKFYNISYSQNIPPLDPSFFLKNQEKKGYNSRNEDFLLYLASLKGYKAEAMQKTMNFNKRRRSAIIIQKSFRGYLVRKAFRTMKTKQLMERIKRILIIKKREYIQNNALLIIMKHLSRFAKKLRLRKKLIFKKFVNHCARLIQRFFKYRVKVFYRLKKQQFIQKYGNTVAKKPSQFKSNQFKSNTPDFSVIKHESNYSSLRATLVLKNDGETDRFDNTAFSLEELPKKSSFEEHKWENKWDNMPIKPANKNPQTHIEGSEGSKNKIEESEAKRDSKTKITADLEPNKYENMPVGGSKNNEEMNKWEMRENMPVGGSKNKDEMNKWEMRENMPVGGGKNKGIIDDNAFEDPNYVSPPKKPVQKREFLKRNKNKISGPKEESKSQDNHPDIKIIKPSESEEQPPKSHFKNFSKNLSEINTQNLNGSYTEENRELTNTLSALTYESPIKTNFKKKSQLFSPAAVSGRSTPLKSQSPVKQPFLKKKNTPKTTKKEKENTERSVSMKKSKEDFEDDKEKRNFLKKKSAAVVSQKLDWKKVSSRTNCWLNKKSPPSSAQKQPMKSQSNNKFNQNLNQNMKKKGGLAQSREVKETIMIKNPEDDLRERIMMMKNQNQMENDYTASNFTLPDNIPIIQINNMHPMQLRPHNMSEGLSSADQHQLNQLMQMSSLELRNNTTNKTSDNKRETSTLSRIYRGSESSIQSSVKMERNMVVDELERAYRTNYFGKLTSVKTAIIKSNEEKNKVYTEIPQLVDTSVFVRKYDPLIFQNLLVTLEEQFRKQSY